jgi:paraquat-inducible protein A
LRLQLIFGDETEMARAPADIVACPDCDLLQRIPPVPPGGTARCARCGRTLAAGKAAPLERTASLALAALVVFILAHLGPRADLSSAGRDSSATILGGVREMWLQGERITAVLVAFFAVVAPFLYIGLMLAVLLLARRPPAPRWAGLLLRWANASGLWSMVEVMMLGILVALVKIAALALVRPGVGFFAVGALVFLIAAMSTGFDPREVWSRVRWANGEWPGEGR